MTCCHRESHNRRTIERIRLLAVAARHRSGIGLSDVDVAGTAIRTGMAVNVRFSEHPEG